MVHAKNYENMYTFVKVLQKKLWPLFFPDTVYTWFVMVLSISGYYCQNMLLQAKRGQYWEAAAAERRRGISVNNVTVISLSLCLSEYLQTEEVTIFP